MSSSIICTGFEDIENMIQDMALSDAEEKKIMKTAIEPAKETIKSNTPVDKGQMQQSVKDTVIKEDMGVVGKVIMNDWATQFQEFGTSQQKHHMGFFERSVNSTTDEVVALIAQGLFSKIK